MWSEAREVYSRNQIITGTRNQKQVPTVTAKHERENQEKAAVAHKVADNDLCKELS